MTRIYTFSDLIYYEDLQKKRNIQTFFQTSYAFIQKDTHIHIDSHVNTHEYTHIGKQEKTHHPQTFKQKKNADLKTQTTQTLH